MKRSIARQWVAALRSGKFEQGRGSLVGRNNDGEKQHCCLGVLCALSPWKNTYDRMGNDDRGTYPPAEVLKWAGLQNKKGVVPDPEDGDMTYLSLLNDEELFTFEQIADVIEQHYQQL